VRGEGGRGREDGDGWEREGRDRVIRGERESPSFLIFERERE